MKNLRLYGRIREDGSANGIPGLNIEVKDTNLFIDDVIAITKSGRDGLFEIDFPPPCTDQPNIYLNIKAPDGRLISSTNCNVMPDLESDKEVNVNIPGNNQNGADLDKDQANKLISWTFLPDRFGQNQLMQEIQKDISGKNSILELLKEYMSELNLNSDRNNLPFSKLLEIFHSGIVPEVIEGHFYGVWIFFRTKDQEDNFPPINHIMQVLLGARLDIRCPWAGKTFIPMSRSQIDSITESEINPDRAFHGTNHFHNMNMQVPINLAFQLFNIWKGMNDATIKEEKKFGHQKNGGYIISAKGPSLCPKINREVLTLNYRWDKLANKPPFCWLIDEVVQIADGLYLGQILSATKHLFDFYDPARPPEDYAYQTYGYFLMFSEGWNKEARRLFPSLDMPSLQ
ncbi:MAG: hypothetical protein ABFD50_22340 [Smithella sp.]